MARPLLGAAVFGNGHGSYAIGSSTMLHLTGTLLMLCMVVAILSALMLGWFGKGKKKACSDPKSNNPRRPSNVVYYTGYEGRMSSGGDGDGDGDGKGDGGDTGKSTCGSK